MIVPVEVNRDAEGYWTHPALARYGQLDTQQFTNWLWLNNLECFVMTMRDEATDAFCAAWKNGPPDASTWDLTPPDGGGWFPGSVHYRDGGPECYWFRQKSG